MKWNYLPNVITVLRFVLVIPIIFFLFQQQYDWALWCFAAAGASDALDGFLAKRFHWESRLGSILDPLADKFLLAATSLVLVWQNYLPLWLVILMVARDLMIVAGASCYHFLLARLELQPTWLSKMNTFLQILLITTVIFDLALAWQLSDLTTILVLLVATSTVVSGGEYVVKWGHLAVMHWRSQREQRH